MNIFNNIRTYGSWSVVESRAFNAEEIASVLSATVVSSIYGNSVEFVMKAGGKKYIPLSNDSTIGVGATFNLSEAKVLKLHKDGEDDIVRVQVIR